jgi:hypothetical protein
MHTVTNKIDSLIHNPVRKERNHLQILRAQANSLTQEIDPGNEQQIQRARSRLAELCRPTNVHIERLLRHRISGESVPTIATNDRVTEDAVYKSFERAMRVLRGRAVGRSYPGLQQEGE